MRYLLLLCTRYFDKYLGHSRIKSNTILIPGTLRYSRRADITHTYNAESTLILITIMKSVAKEIDKAFSFPSGDLRTFLLEPLTSL